LLVMFSQWHRILHAYTTQPLYQKKNKNPNWAAIEDLETPPEDMSVQGRIYYRKPKQVDVS
jgi:hypothetical protein